MKSQDYIENCNDEEHFLVQEVDRLQKMAPGL
jgi:hypothetical protein